MANGFTDGAAGAVGREMATLAVWANDGKGGFTQGQLKVDPEQLPTVKATFVQAREKFKAMVISSQKLQNIAPPGDDEVSKKAVQDLGKFAGDGDGCLGKTLNDCIARCDDIIGNVEKSMQLYKVADTSASIKLKP
ncbi:hypothetical protein [Kutzneria buriramensis]|uniref:Excreted virulence factor EspC (Type VII ESX diderm) n=1 Tax=Kutzneria buriramensis TaxID=1045776 RepID=A0A3E0HPS9_9PSEU|nr:hypothetical protein [Kutzneria buriramensis]REH48424.1 hypothetical protein BCF44_105283 [Kutzneria buriramensis]